MRVTFDIKTVIFAVLLLTATFLIYGRSVFNDFVYDDFAAILSNKFIEKTIDPMAYFKSPHAAFGNPTEPDNIYRPIGIWLFAIQTSAFGKDPFWFHLISILIHASNALLFFFLLRSFFKTPDIAFAGAFLFAIHPIQTEVVAWAFQQTTLWSLFFSLVALLILNAKTLAAQKKYVLLCLMSAFAIFSKEQMVVLPFIALFLLFVSEIQQSRGAEQSIAATIGKIMHRYWKELALIALPAVLFILLRLLVIGTLSQAPVWEGGRTTMALTMLHAFATYIHLIAWPHPLSVNYDLFPLTQKLTEPYLLWSIAVLGGVVICGLAALKRSPFVFFGVAWFFLALAPVSNILFPMTQALNERFLYVALPGLIVALCSGFTYAMDRTPRRARFTLGVSGIVFAAVALTLSIKTYLRVADWENHVTLWAAEMRVTPQSWRTRVNYGFGLEMQNNSLEAIEHYKVAYALTQNPNAGIENSSLFSVVIADNLAKAYLRVDRADDAIAQIVEVLKNKPNPSMRAAFFRYLGAALLKKKDYAEATKAFSLASENGELDDVTQFYRILSVALSGASDDKVRSQLTTIKNDAFRRAAPELIRARKEIDREEWAKAAVTLDAVLRTIVSPSIDFLLWAAESREKSGDRAGAYTLYLLILKYEPQSIEAYQGIKRLDALLAITNIRPRTKT